MGRDGQWKNVAGGNGRDTDSGFQVTHSGLVNTVVFSRSMIGVLDRHKWLCVGWLCYSL